MPTRRAALAVAALWPAGALLGCGFELRRAATLPMKTIALTGFAPGSPLAAAMRRALRDSGVALRDNPAQAEAVLEALTDVRERTVAASTAIGQVRELQLRVRLRFRLATPAGRLLIAPTDLLLTRDMSFSETAALAKQQEEALLYGAMDEDIVAQVLRRLASVQLGP